MADVGKNYITQKILDKICEHIAGGASVRKFPFKESNITSASFYAWLDRHATEKQLEQYVRAKDAHADALFDECLDIADDDSLDIGFTEDGRPFVKGENIQRAKLRVETRMRMAGKIRPKKYGDKVQLAGDQDAPVQLRHSGKVEISPDEAYLRMLNGRD